MQRFRHAQTCGSLVVFGSFAAAEGAARYLDAAPGSSFAWYLNLEVFGPFQAARAGGSPLHVLSGPNALTLYTAILALVVGAHAVGSRFATALFCNLALIAVAMLAHAWFFLAKHAAVASLAAIDLGRESDLLLLGLVVVSAMACALSHLSFAGSALRQGTPFRPDAHVDEVAAGSWSEMRGKILEQSPIAV